MLSYFLPLALVVLSNTFYHICSKSLPGKMDPFAVLTISYSIGAVVSFILYFVFNKGGSIVAEWEKTNWAPFVLGIVIIGLEAGYIMVYKAGWQVSTAQIVQSAIVAVILIFVGALIYNEQITWNKILGIVICLTGLYFINMK